MDWRWVLFTGAVIIVMLAVTVVLVLALRPRVDRQFFARTGVERWRSTAAHLSWRDRWILFMANSRGRAAPRRLAARAVERGEVALAMIERSTAKKSAIRRFWLSLGGFWILLGLGHLLLIAAGGGTWWGLISAIVGVVTVFLAIGPVQARQARLIRRSVELSREQLDRRG